MAKKRSQHDRKYYPWEKWLNRKTAFTIKPKKDFSATQESMLVMIRTRAKEHKKKITVNKHEDGSITIRPRIKK